MQVKMALELLHMYLEGDCLSLLLAELSCIIYFFLLPSGTVSVLKDLHAFGHVRR